MSLCLIVNECQANRDIVAQMAISCGMEVLEAEDGLEALLICHDVMPDMIVMDWMLPELNGIEFLSLLRNMTNGDKPHVIMCSAKKMTQRFSNVANFDATHRDHFHNSLKESMIRCMF